ncbi:ketopantoate hydroxymethyltransferase-domain-containing protein [Gamsiella multidivaricata]|uniref:ketopantoate hydroxymethyltransferase-domain-containing protein n=1 Tax=Gamsiella multidivaricata TaxID=101098 RepID=UPI00221F5A46|nr:ketopantoate hydroxymethyltransferase-domain-containing protein [Gamsiella multidivaricata]KAI7829786.1 ketopantoate hydroxymethyltransferase-domain-containing protein [Gamsiella multidivaricata]
MSISARLATQVRGKVLSSLPRSAATGLVACSSLRIAQQLRPQQMSCSPSWTNHPTQSGVHMRSYSSRPAEPDLHHVRPKVTLATLRKLYKRKEPITVMTAHDFPTGSLVDKAGIDMTLVGDSLAMVALGYTSTSEITLDEMLHHSRAVARGTRSSFLVADMPFGTYETNADQAVNNAVRILKEGKAEAVKLEGGKEIAPTVARLTQVGIPVLGHIGLTPQRQASLGGYKVQGKTVAKAKAMMEDALALQRAGCYAIVLEAVPEPVARHITNILSIPTIGIGAGAGCSGQVLVQQDMLGLYGRVPRFCKTYRNLADEIVGALQEYSADVKSGAFPAEEHCYPMPQAELDRFMHMIAEEKQHEEQSVSPEAVAAGLA